MPAEESVLHNNNLSEDTPTVFRDGDTDGNRIEKNSGQIGSCAETNIHIFIPSINKEPMMPPQGTGQQQDSGINKVIKSFAYLEM